jgi:hypothetical protein
MRYVFVLFLIGWGSLSVSCQSIADTLSGQVSYMTSQSIYVKFSSTRDINVGDTLYMIHEYSMVSAVVVKNMSSTSCVGTSISNVPLLVGTRIMAKIKPPPPQQPSQSVTPLEIALENISKDTLPDEVDVEISEQKKISGQKSGLKGRIAAAAYINFSDLPQGDRQRMRYTLTMNSRRINNTGLSVETYMSFRHTINEWQEVQDNFKRAFKVYSLALEYDLDNGTRFWAGRKINFNISNIGAIDGIQGEKKWKKTLMGAFAGSRPDHTDYGFNPNLFQYGVYAGNSIEGEKGTIQNTLAFVEQRNHSMTDRRFAYFQHVNSMIKRINIFTSFEFDLYKLENEQPKNTLDITSLYVSIRYRTSDKLSFFGSYDARNNIIYYETYKNTIDQLLEDETRQGFRFSFNYRPLKRISIGSNAGYRFQKDNPTSSKNLNSYITFSRVPGLGISATLSAVLIQSAYLDGIIYGIRASRDIINGKLFGEIDFRTVEYRYKNVETPLTQSIIGTNLSWRFSKTLSFGFNYESEISNRNLTSRIYTNIIQRF